MKNMKKILVLALAALLLVAVSVAGTVAYLTAKTDPVINTFTPTTISVSLSETIPAQNTAQIIPGKVIEKNPTVKASATDKVAYWVFVEITEGNWLAAKEANGTTRKLEYVVDTAWTLLGTNKNGAKVYYKNMPNGGSIEAAVLKDNQVSVSSTLTAEEMSAAQNSTLTFKAYAIQQETFASAAAGYKEASGNEVTVANTDTTTP